jgi:hypothetical protein
VHAACPCQGCYRLHGAAPRTRYGKPACLQACRPLLCIKDTPATPYLMRSRCKLVMPRAAVGLPALRGWHTLNC